jgi:hypothetical protein
MFKQVTTKPLSWYVLQTLMHKSKMPTDQDNLEDQDKLEKRKSPRFQQKNTSGKAVTKLAQLLLAKKFGILPKQEELDQMTLQ